MNLAEALGVEVWRDRRAIVDTVVVQPSIHNKLDELWCWSVDLESFWEDVQDPRWLLLIAIAQALGVSSDQLFPCDQPEDKPASSHGVAFGEVLQGMVALPSLDELLMQPSLKRKLWQTLCQHFLSHA